ncbi:MAG: glycosyltransferase family 4 protein [Acidimicrobiales bacterium]
MRIAHVTDCYLPRLGGIELQVHDLVSRQAAHHDVTIFTITQGASRLVDTRTHCEASQEAARIIAVGATRTSLEGAGLERMTARTGRIRRATFSGVARLGGDRRAGATSNTLRVDVKTDVKAQEKIKYLRARFGPSWVGAHNFDVVHVHASSFSPLAFLVARSASLRGIPTVATVHSMWAKASPLFDAADLLCGWGDWPVAWSAVSSAAAQPLRSIVGRRGDVTVLANGVDPSQWDIEPEPPAPNQLRIVSVSRLASRKRVVQLVHLLRKARRKVPSSIEMHVEILGDGPQMGEIRSYLEVNSMTGWVHLRGRVTRAEIRDTFARSDLFVAPASLESFGIAALEARTAGLPIVARTRTGVADFVTHGVEGWLVNSDAAMAETIASLARSPELVARVAVHNRLYPPRVDWQSVEHCCEDLYRRAAGIHGRQIEPVFPRAPVSHLLGPDVPASRLAAPGGRPFREEVSPT